MLHKLHRKIQRNVSDYGVRVTLRKSVLYMLKPFYEARSARVYGIDLEAGESSRETGTFSNVETLDADDSSLVWQIEAMEEWLQGQVRTKLSDGSLCVVALDDQRLLGFNLVSFGQIYIPLVHQSRTLGDDEAWSEQISVHPDCRGRGLGASIRYRVFQELGQKGIKRLYGVTLPYNAASLALAGKVGFTELGDIQYKKVGFTTRWSYRQVGKSELANALWRAFFEQSASPPDGLRGTRNATLEPFVSAQATE